MNNKLIYCIFIIIYISVLNLAYTQSIFADGTYDIKKMTPEIKSALENRRSRYNELRDLKQKNIIGENNRGYLKLLVQDNTAKILVDNENKDRRLIYTKILEQNNLDKDTMSTIEKVKSKPLSACCFTSRCPIAST